MGKVLSVFDNGFPGSVSRSIDDIIIVVKCNETNGIEFGAPVFLDASGYGIAVNANSAYDRFLGFAVRAAAKTPAGYTDSRAKWLAGEDMEVLVRGAILVNSMSESPTTGDAVYLRKTDGKVTGQSASGANIELANCRFRKAPAAAGVAEIQVLTRHIL